MEIQKQFSGIMAVVTFGISKKVRDIAGAIDHITVQYEKMKIIIAKSSKYFYIISDRKSLPHEVVDKLRALIISER